MGGHHKLHSTHLQVVVVNMDVLVIIVVVLVLVSVRSKMLIVELILTQPSLILIGTGASLMGFYRLQMLEVFCLILLEVFHFYLTLFCSSVRFLFYPFLLKFFNLILPYFAWGVRSLFYLILLEVVDLYFTLFCSRCSIFILPYFAWNVWSLFCH